MLVLKGSQRILVLPTESPNYNKGVPTYLLTYLLTRSVMLINLGTGLTLTHSYHSAMSLCVLSNDVASGSEITPCNKIDKPLVVYSLLIFGKRNDVQHNGITMTFFFSKDWVQSNINVI